jgi:hypothetical protein
VESQRSYAIAGTGHRARTYIQALTGPYREVARVAALCDPNVARADHYRSAYGLHDVPVVAPEDFSPGYQGMRRVLVGIAANRSLAEGRPVQLAEFGFE